jgi:hypothetical protein
MNAGVEKETQINNITPHINTKLAWASNKGRAENK